MILNIHRRGRDWRRLRFPKGTPKNIIDKLAINLDAALEDPRTLPSRIGWLIWARLFPERTSVLPQNSPALSNLRFLVDPLSSRLRTQRANRPDVRGVPQPSSATCTSSQTGLSYASFFEELQPTVSIIVTIRQVQRLASSSSPVVSPNYS